MDQLTVGVEEEFQIVDAETNELASRAERVLSRARRLVGTAAEEELNRCQVEVATPVCRSLDEVDAHLRSLRESLQVAAAAEGSRIVAVGSHPVGSWEEQEVGPCDRYQRIEDEYQIVAREQVICGCHVHVGVPDADAAVAVMDRIGPWLPTLLALSANSPFWQGIDTGYDSYRTEVWRRWPTFGMPPRLGDDTGYRALVDEMVSGGAIDDPTHLYWLVRPSERWPTVELRACDVCLTADEATMVAGLSRALAWTAMQDASAGRPPPDVPRDLLEAATWRAARFGLGDELLSAVDLRPRPAAEVVHELLDHVRDGLDVHDDRDRVEAQVEAVLGGGNGATRQRAAFAQRGDCADVIRCAVEQTTGSGRGGGGPTR
jgi:carboxylate-amine ligase